MKSMAMKSFKYRIATNHVWWAMNHETTEMNKWLKNKFGPVDGNWKAGMQDDKLCIEFRHEKDAIMFSLIWL
jgi:hypothetical protein